ncbi:MAG: uroporphyrinogen decarboxylase family protein [Kiritimatiellia bacterium]|jgi:uroporphyrinogen decarboxylase|nr:uroporphyrinogen decarboxylase family protein [Kiritimatiellia bacterium]
MNGTARMCAALRRELPDRIPTFEWFLDAGVGRALTGSGDPLDIVERLDLDGINIRPDYARRFTDAQTFEDEWGTRRRLTGDCLPAVIAQPVPDVTRHAGYTFPDPRADFRFATLRRAAERFGDTRAIILNVRDGFSDLRDLLGYEAALMAPLTEPEACAAFLDRIVDYNLALAERAVRTFGVRILATTDDVAMASGPLFPPEVYRERLLPAFRRAIQGFKALGCLTIKHCDGDILPLADPWIDAGIDCLDPIDPGAGLTMAAMKARYGGRIALKGNIDCVKTLCTGTPDTVRDEVRRCIADGGPAGLILSSSNTIHRGVKPENYRAMLEALRAYGTFPAEAQSVPERQEKAACSQRRPRA